MIALFVASVLCACGLVLVIDYADTRRRLREACETSRAHVSPCAVCRSPAQCGRIRTSST